MGPGDSMRRRDFIGTLCGMAAAWPAMARAQQSTGKIARIGFLGTTVGNFITAQGYPAFLDELKKSGFSVGHNLIIEEVSDIQDPKRFFVEAADFARSNVDVLVATGPEITLQAAAAASQTIPIVFWAINYDPIERGYVKSLSRPGGNITGLVSLQTELAAKQVELLTQALPGRTQLAILWDGLSVDQFAAAEHQAKSLGLNVQSLKMETPPYNFDAAFRNLSEGSPQMLLVLSSRFFSDFRARIAELAIQQRLPTMFIFKSYVQAGGLISYGIDPSANFRQVGFYVGKILNGAKAADLPVEQATKFELAVNLKTAKAIGIDLTTSILLRADEVIE